MKRFFALASVVIFLGAVLLFVPFFGFAMNPQPEPPAQIKSGIAVDESYLGTIIRIEGNKITVKNEKGVEKVITSNITGLKIGSKVQVTTKNGLTWLNPQPEPLLPMKTKPVNK